MMKSKNGIKNNTNEMSLVPSCSIADAFSKMKPIVATIPTMQIQEEYKNEGSANKQVMASRISTETQAPKIRLQNSGSEIIVSSIDIVKRIKKTMKKLFHVLDSMSVDKIEM